MGEFVSLCKLTRILSHIWESVYTASRRKGLEEMTKTFSGLLDRWKAYYDKDFFVISDAASKNHPMTFSRVYILSLHAYARWLLHRPALSLSRDDPRYAAALQPCLEAALSLIKIREFAEKINCVCGLNPAMRRQTIFLAAVTLLFSIWQTSRSSPAVSSSLEPRSIHSVCVEAVELLRYDEYQTIDSDIDHSAILRRLLESTFHERANLEPHNIFDDMAQCTGTCYTKFESDQAAELETTSQYVPIPNWTFPIVQTWPQIQDITFLSPGLWDDDLKNAEVQAWTNFKVPCEVIPSLQRVQSNDWSNIHEIGVTNKKRRLLP